jgi:hypothetical protein
MKGLVIDRSVEAPPPARMIMRPCRQQTLFTALHLSCCDRRERDRFLQSVRGVVAKVVARYVAGPR